MNQREAFAMLKQLLAEEDGQHKLLEAASKLEPPPQGQNDRTYHPVHSANDLGFGIHQKLRTLQEHLKTGKITDSPLVDNVIATFSSYGGRLSVNSPQLYQLVWAATELEQRVEKNQGELIALIDQRIRNILWGDDCVIERVIRLGYLNGAPCGESTLLTGLHVAFCSIGWNNGEYYKRCTGDIELAPPCDGVGEPPLAGLRTLLDISRVNADFTPDPERPIFCREVLVGDNEISDWFQLRGKREVLATLIRLLEAPAVAPEAA